jgi:hypothetical protein
MLFFFLPDFLLKLTKQVASFSNAAAIIQIVEFSFAHGKVILPGNVFLIWLDSLLANALILDVLVVTLLARIVQVRVEVKHLAPGQVEVVHMLVQLFTHIDKVETTNSVICHYNAT